MFNLIYLCHKFLSCLQGAQSSVFGPLSSILTTLRDSYLAGDITAESIPHSKCIQCQCQLLVWLFLYFCIVFLFSVKELLENCISCHLQFFLIYVFLHALLFLINGVLFTALPKDCSFIPVLLRVYNSFSFLRESNPIYFVWKQLFQICTLCVDYFPLYIQYLAKTFEQRRNNDTVWSGSHFTFPASEAAFFYVHFYPAVTMLGMESPARLVGWLRFAWC